MELSSYKILEQSELFGNTLSKELLPTVLGKQENHKALNMKGISPKLRLCVPLWGSCSVPRGITKSSPTPKTTFFSDEGKVQCVAGAFGSACWWQSCFASVIYVFSSVPGSGNCECGCLPGQGEGFHYPVLCEGQRTPGNRVPQRPQEAQRGLDKSQVKGNWARGGSCRRGGEGGGKKSGY